MSTPSNDFGAGSQYGSAPPPPLGQSITMLGARQTGKTTFLGALHIALLRREDPGWALGGDNKGSADALVKFVREMTDDHIFPHPTGAVENYKWSLRAEVPGRIRLRRGWPRREMLDVRLPLDLVDAPGEMADDTKPFGRAGSRNLLDSLANSGGIVLFFDPVREFEHGDAFRNMYGVLVQLQALMQREGKLPHYVAVCITKFDDMSVYQAAQKLEIVTFDPVLPELPHVREEYAEEFFKRLLRLSRGDAADLVLPMLHQTFRKERIKFFVTSAIGFYVNPRYGVFDPEDYQNHILREYSDGLDHIRGGIYPINVIEPIVWLGRHVLRGAG